MFSGDNSKYWEAREKEKRKLGCADREKKQSKVLPACVYKQAGLSEDVALEWERKSP